MKKRKTDPMLHYEGESDVEDIYDTPSQEADVPADILAEVPPVIAVKKKVKTRHCIRACVCG
jgi:hypothetical protein